MMRKDILSDKRIRGILFVIIVCLQLVFIAYWARQKMNLFVDEEYSLEYASYFTSVKYGSKMPYTEAFLHNTWIQAKDLKVSYSLEPEESLLHTGPWTMIMLLLKRRIYYGLINIAETILSPGRVSIMPAIVLNMIIFAGIQIVLYKILKKLHIRNEYALWGVAFYGFSSLMIGHTIFIRFYTFTILLFLLVLLLHQKMWEEKNTGMFILEEGTALVLLYFSLKCSELTMIYGGAFVGMYLLMLIVNKKYKTAGLYGIPMLGISLLYLGMKTELLNILLHPSMYVNSSFAKSYTTKNVVNASWGSVWFWLKTHRLWIGQYLFGNTQILDTILLVLLVLLVWKRDRFFQDPSRFLMLSLLVTVLIYILFASLSGLFRPKYVCVVYTLIVIVFLYVFDRAMKDLSWQFVIQAGLCVLLAVIVYGTYDHRDIEYLYEEDTAVVNQLRNNPDLDILFLNCDIDRHHAIYDCVYNAGDQARIFFDDPDMELMEEEMPDHMFVWTNETMKSEISEELPGYEVELVGNNHNTFSNIYLAHRRNRNE